MLPANAVDKARDEEVRPLSSNVELCLREVVLYILREEVGSEEREPHVVKVVGSLYIEQT